MEICLKSNLKVKDLYKCIDIKLVYWIYKVVEMVNDNKKDNVIIN